MRTLTQHAHNACAWKWVWEKLKRDRSYYSFQKDLTVMWKESRLEMGKMLHWCICFVSWLTGENTNAVWCVRAGRGQSFSRLSCVGARSAPCWRTRVQEGPGHANQPKTNPEKTTTEDRRPGTWLCSQKEALYTSPGYGIVSMEIKPNNSRLEGGAGVNTWFGRTARTRFVPALRAKQSRVLLSQVSRCRR